LNEAIGKEMKKSIILTLENVETVKTHLLNEHIQQFLDKWFKGVMPTIEQYKIRIYELWQDPSTRNNIFGNIPINENGKGGFTTACPPIPWMGNLQNAQYALVSLEPLLDQKNFQDQVDVAANFEGWNNFYFENYFKNFNGLLQMQKQNSANFLMPEYWPRLSDLFRNNIQENPYEILGSTIVEVPLCPYHAASHPRFSFPNLLIGDFLLRLSYFLIGPAKKKIIALGSDGVLLLVRLFEIDIEETVNVLERNVKTMFCLPIRYSKASFNDTEFHLFLRNKPFNRGVQHQRAERLIMGQIIREI
jgi:hypothetical protein